MSTGQDPVHTALTEMTELSHRRIEALRRTLTSLPEAHVALPLFEEMAVLYEEIKKTLTSLLEARNAALPLLKKMAVQYEETKVTMIRARQAGLWASEQGACCIPLAAKTLCEAMDIDFELAMERMFRDTRASEGILALVVPGRTGICPFCAGKIE